MQQFSSRSRSRSRDNQTLVDIGPAGSGSIMRPKRKSGREKQLQSLAGFVFLLLVFAFFFTRSRGGDRGQAGGVFVSTKTHVLVTGGAGFIGSHAALALIESGNPVTVLDNLSRGNLGAFNVLQKLAKPGQLRFWNVDLGDKVKS